MNNLAALCAAPAMTPNQLRALRPTGAYVGGTYAALGIGALGFAVGLWNAEMTLSEKGFYFIALLYGLFAAVSLQRVNRDKAECLPVSSAYSSLCYGALGSALLAILVGLWNATLLLSEKGYYAVCFILAIYAAITLQKNIRDISLLDRSGRSGSALDSTDKDSD